MIGIPSLLLIVTLSLMITRFKGFHGEIAHREAVVEFQESREGEMPDHSAPRSRETERVADLTHCC